MTDLATMTDRELAAETLQVIKDPLPPGKLELEARIRELDELVAESNRRTRYWEAR